MALSRTYCRNIGVTKANVKRIKQGSIIDQETGCWLWQGAISHSGYGIIWDSHRKKIVRVHRLAYELFKGEIAAVTPFVLHRCDVRACCNPEHLFLGTQLDNMADMMGKGRTGHRGAHRKTICKHGHDLTQKNSCYIYPDGRRRGCQACRVAHRKKRRTMTCPRIPQ